MHFTNFVAGAALVSLVAAAPTATNPKSSRVSPARRSYEVTRRAAPLPKRDSSATVTGTAAVTTVNDNDGVGAGSNTYTSYSGDGSSGAGWPTISQWVSFTDMFNANKPAMQESCGNNYGLANDSDDEVADIQSAIESIAGSSGVDHRYILAVIMQESNGCVRVPTTNNGISNPGLMQDYEGYYTCNDNTNIENDGSEVYTPCPSDHITGMIREGAVGTDTGDGLASLINESESDGATDAQVFYRAARYYNSGSVCSSDLSDACGATASYSSDIANRLTGWLGN